MIADAAVAPPHATIELSCPTWGARIRARLTAAHVRQFVTDFPDYSAALAAYVEGYDRRRVH